MAAHMPSFYATVALALFLAPKASAHIALWHPSIYGFNVTEQTFSYDNRPVIPLAHMTFAQWWFHGHLDYPPHKSDVLHLPAGGTATVEVACGKGYTSHYASAEGGDVRSTKEPNSPCPGAPTSQYHAVNEDDVTGCALAIARKPSARDVQPEDFVVFSVNHKCVWTRFTDFQVPADMPACPPGGCTCAWFWIHSPESGEQQMYMNGFQCDVTGARVDAPALAKPQLARRCGADPANGRPANPSNCTQGAKQPLYWYQAERNNMFEGTYSPPLYNDLYDFKNGAQNDIFAPGSHYSANYGTPSRWASAIRSDFSVRDLSDGGEAAYNGAQFEEGNSAGPGNRPDRHLASPPPNSKQDIKVHLRRSSRVLGGV